MPKPCKNSLKSPEALNCISPWTWLDVSQQFFATNPRVVQDRLQGPWVQFRMYWDSDEGDVVGQRDMTSPLSQNPEAEMLRQYLDQFSSRNYR
jgi:hypothetical protein